MYLEGPQHPADVWEVPKQGDADDVGGDDAEGDFLGVVDGEVPAGEFAAGEEVWFWRWWR